MRFAILLTLLWLVGTPTVYAQQSETPDSLIDKLLADDENDLDGKKTQKLLDDFKSGRVTELRPAQPKTGTAPKPNSVTINVKMSETEAKHLREKISEHLRKHKQHFKSPGVELLEPKHLDPRLLVLRPVKTPNGLRAEIVFTDAFDKHIAVQGRRHLLNQRLPMTATVAGSILAAMFFLFGTLKVLNARAKQRDDYISTSQVPMV